jgi:hypothetical protein
MRRPTQCQCAARKMHWLPTRCRNFVATVFCPEAQIPYGSELSRAVQLYFTTPVLQCGEITAPHTSTLNTAILSPGFQLSSARISSAAPRHPNALRTPSTDEDNMRSLLSTPHGDLLIRILQEYAAWQAPVLSKCL